MKNNTVLFLFLILNGCAINDINSGKPSETNLPDNNQESIAGKSNKPSETNLPDNNQESTAGKSNKLSKTNLPDNNQESANRKNDLISLTPYSKLHRRFSPDPSPDFSDSYTRLLIKSTVEGEGRETITDLDYKTRWAISRFWSGVHNTTTLTAKVNVGGFSATVPLVTIEHISNSDDGEQFSRIINHQAQKYPLFLIKGSGANGVASVQFVVRAANQYQSNAAAIAIQVAESVTKSVAPQSAILTTLTQQKTKDIASALDKSISQQFNKSLDEEQWIENDIRRWGDGVTVQFMIPENEGKWDGETSKTTIGYWKVQFENPHPSIFSDIQICNKPSATDKSSATDKPSNEDSLCAKDFKEAVERVHTNIAKKPADVLSFQLINDGGQSLGTIYGFLKQQDWWQTSLQKFSNNKNLDPESVTQFCRAIKQAIVGLNLNSIDAGIVSNSVGNAAILPGQVILEMHKQPAECSVITL